MGRLIMGGVNSVGSDAMALVLLAKSLEAEEDTKVGVVTRTLDELNRTKPTARERMAQSFKFNNRLMRAAFTGVGTRLDVEV